MDDAGGVQGRHGLGDRAQHGQHAGGGRTAQAARIVLEEWHGQPEQRAVPQRFGGPQHAGVVDDREQVVLAAQRLPCAVDLLLGTRRQIDDLQRDDIGAVTGLPHIGFAAATHAREQLEPVEDPFSRHRHGRRSGRGRGARRGRGRDAVLLLVDRRQQPPPLAVLLLGGARQLERAPLDLYGLAGRLAAEAVG